MDHFNEQAKGLSKALGIDIQPGDIIRAMRPFGPLDSYDIVVWCDACNSGQRLRLRDIQEGRETCSCGQGLRLLLETLSQVDQDSAS